MRVVLLSPYPERLGRIFEGDKLITQSHNGPIPECDFVVSYGHRHIIKPPTLERYKDRIINVHCSYLPYNRGADPNFWSWHDDSPKGVTIHHIDEGVDTGDIITQFKVRWLRPERETLESTYWHLQDHALFLLRDLWGRIKRGEALLRTSHSGGTLHRKKDMEAIKLPMGWKTPVSYVEDLGRRSRENEDRKQVKA